MEGFWVWLKKGLEKPLHYKWSNIEKSFAIGCVGTSACLTAVVIGLHLLGIIALVGVIPMILVFSYGIYIGNLEEYPND